jgi:hypothetical protein
VTIRILEKVSAANRALLLMLLAVATVLGGFEGLFGRLRYTGDAISYLNIARAIHAGDWKLALNPMWGIGYPLILSVVTSVFPKSPMGDWLAIHCLDLAIFIAAFLSFYYLVLVAAGTPRLRWILEDVKAQRFLIVGGFTIFLSIELAMDNVSRVGPDMLISCLMFLATALLIQLQERGEMRLAIALGAITGLGCVVKNVFLPLTFVFALLLVLTQTSKKTGLRAAVIMLATAAVFIVPYVSGLSWALGRFTFGESGSLNYAWHVNKLQDGAFWEGWPSWPASYGKPIHPPQMVVDSPHVFLFKEPFHVTFPLFYNPPYFYEGYRHYFSLKAQLLAVVHNAYQVVRIWKTEFFVDALILVWILTILGAPKPRKWLGRRLGLLPMVAISCVGIAMYVMVWVEGRYITSFVAMLLLSLLFAVMMRGRESLESGTGVRRGAILLWILVAGCAGTLIATGHDESRDVWGHLRRHELFYNDSEWKAALYLRERGLAPGDHVAVVSDVLHSAQANWAYMDHLLIIGQLRGEYPPYPTNDFDVFWGSSPERQKEILEIFHRAGARMVFSIEKPAGVVAPGWEPIPGTEFWMYWFSGND